MFSFFSCGLVVLLTFSGVTPIKACSPKSYVSKFQRVPSKTRNLPQRQGSHWQRAAIRLQAPETWRKRMPSEYVCKSAPYHLHLQGMPAGPTPAIAEQA